MIYVWFVAEREMKNGPNFAILWLEDVGIA